MRNQIFISYSHQDKNWLERLQTNLVPLLRGTSILAWDDTRIQAGSDWKEEIDKGLSSAKIAVLLVSSDFLASDFIFKNELPYLLQAAEAGDLKVIAIAVRPSAWESTGLASRQWANDPKKPLSGLEKTDREEELVKICKVIASHFVEPRPVPTPEKTIPHTTVKAHFDATSGVMSVPVEGDSQSAEEGLRALVKLMQDPDVQAKVATFKAVFETSSMQIEVLGYYKDLHDLLHTLQFNCYNYLTSIVRTAKRDPDDMSIWENVVEYELVLQSILDGLDKASKQSSLSQAQPWIQRLIQDLKLLFQALEQNNPEQIDAAIRPVQRVLATEPSRINDRLSAAAEALPLPMLVEALTGVRNSLDKTRVNPVTVKKFVDGVQALDGLKTSLATLIVSHNTWQNVDIVIRRIEGNMAQDYSELEYSWSDLKTMTETQFNGCDELWAQLLRKEIAKLDKALEEADAIRIRQSFQSFRTRANRRFYDVDLTLKELCDKLRKIGDPLFIAWEMIK